ncbi:hypothetical protein INR49_002839 [Caranx melampygus]|nr:hypothetical protein INR49_002839 [Caranx melampygus]
MATDETRSRASRTAPPCCVSLPLSYVLGLLFKALYYCCFHPRLWRPPARDPGLPDDLPDAE